MLVTIVKSPSRKIPDKVVRIALSDRARNTRKWSWKVSEELGFRLPVA